MTNVPVQSIHSFLSEDWIAVLDLAAGAGGVATGGSEEWEPPLEIEDISQLAHPKDCRSAGVKVYVYA